MRKPHFLLALMALVLLSCSDAASEPTFSEEPDRSATATTSTTALTASSTTTSVAPASSTTHPPESMWPADPPGRHALFEGETLTVVDGPEKHENPDIADTPTAAGFVGDTLVFSIGCCDGIWAWDYADSDVADPLVDGGDDPVILQGVAPNWDQPGFFYTKGDNHRGEDLMFYDLGSGESRRFLETSDRHADLTEEELNATLGSAVATEEEVGLLVAFGDSTWVEWYTETGQPMDPPFEGIDQGETVLELAIAPGDELLAIGREQQLHQGITTVEVIATTGDVRSYSVPDEHSLRHLNFDGRYVTASVHSTDPSDGSEGSSQRVILDIEENHFSYSPGPPILAVS